jgi:hypothetical protein
VFGYFVLAQPAGYFLTKMTLGFSHAGEFKVLPIYRLEDVANFLMLTLAGCGVSFELPVLLVLFGAIGLVSARGLWKFNKYALILAAVVGAVLTPQHGSLHPAAAGRPALRALQRLHPGGLADRAGAQEARRRARDEQRRLGHPTLRPAAACSRS